MAPPIDVIPTTRVTPSQSEVHHLYDAVLHYHQQWCQEPLSTETVVTMSSESCMVTLDMVAWDWVTHYATRHKVIPSYLFSRWVRDAFIAEQ